MFGLRPEALTCKGTILLQMKSLEHTLYNDSLKNLAQLSQIGHPNSEVHFDINLTVAHSPSLK